ncbi:Ku protein [Luteolibacter flavescens]|uniref:Non-homologous end joining protein Ku n=1 Tax=Luteolibacter flavescens TaxID=1859460 RepID=A0ABT3FS00_9BACT|nr:Ku protein [Luteolibacter flavescens]MCW1886011.1 Ku protein [Luteolibacter flavescens]
MATRSIWKGAIAFGLVNIPVGLASAEQESEIKLNLVDKTNHARIRYEKVNAETGKPVAWENLVRGYEHDEGEFILLDEKELEAVQPKLTKTIEIERFVDLADIEPMLFEKPYYLEPEKRGKKAYALLRETLRETGKAGIARVVIRSRGYLAAMFVRGEVIVLEVLRYPEELKAVSKLDLPGSKDADFKPGKKELDLAKNLVSSMTEEWDPSEHHDEYQQALLDYIEKKAASGKTAAVKGGDRDKDEGKVAATKVIDLAAYLEQSLKGKSTKTAKKKPDAKKAPAKKAAAKKAAKKARKKSA